MVTGPFEMENGEEKIMALGCNGQETSCHTPELVR